MRIYRVVMLGRRFFSAIRREGIRAAFRKTRIYLEMRRSGVHPSHIIDAESPGGAAPTCYLSGIWQELARQEAFHPAAPARRERTQRKIAIIGDLNLPQCRKYRVEQLAEFWRDKGVICDYAHFQDVPRAVNLLQDATHLFEYRLTQNPLTRMYRYEARRLRLPVLYDIDDPLFSISAYATYGNMEMIPAAEQAHFLEQAPHYLEMMSGADALSFSTPGLIEHAEYFLPGPKFLRRNFADRETLDAGAEAMKVTQRGPCLRLGFASGSRGHEADFRIIMDDVVRFLAQNPRHELHILGHFDIGVLPPEFRKSPQVTRIGYTGYRGYLAALAGVDLLLAPLCDDMFNQTKSAVRVMDAASVGVPAMVGAVGDLPSVVRDGDTGFVVANPDGWSDALRNLPGRTSFLRQMGARARANLEAQWHAGAGAHVVAPEFISWVLE